MEIVRYPDPCLRRRNAPVERFDTELEALAREMFQAMYRTGGVGLAAPQVGVNRRLLVYNPTGKAEESAEERVLCNPRIAWKAREKESGEEGCLSFPGIYAQVLRPVGVRVEALDLSGEPLALELSGWEARVFLHEYDHLDGILFIDRMSPADRLAVKPRLEELEAAWKEARTGS